MTRVDQWLRSSGPHVAERDGCELRFADRGMGFSSVGSFVHSFQFVGRNGRQRHDGRKLASQYSRQVVFRPRGFEPPGREHR